MCISKQFVCNVILSDQTKVVIVDNSKHNRLGNIFKKIFLPQGFPDSVSNDYIAYQIWDTAQAFCSTIMGNHCLSTL